MNIVTNSLSPAPRALTASRPQPEKNCEITNFGGNQTWKATCYQPQSEEAVLEILRQHKDQTIRPRGSLHSWSDVAVSDGVTLDMSALNQVRMVEIGSRALARVGAGASLQTVLDTLHSQSERTLPTLGAIKKQTISGAISTGTHGSGKQSLSHFIEGVRVAAYDPETGEPKVFEYRDGEQLQAARCGLGCMGVILSVDVATTPKYLVHEKVATHPTLESVLERYEEAPLTQFLLVPYRWDYAAFERTPVEMRELSTWESVKAGLHRVFNTVGVDVLFHAALKGAMMIGDGAVKNFLKLSPHLLLKTEVTADSEQILTMGHDYFRHEEMELFVPESQLAESVELVRYVTDTFADEEPEPAPAVETALREMGMWDELQDKKGSYVQHYPFFFRKVLPEDTLISMGASLEAPSYSLSVFTYKRPDDREEYYDFCSLLARALTRQNETRLHWGKHFPLTKEEVEPLYPEMETFRDLAQRTDPEGVFRNAYTERVLGL